MDPSTVVVVLTTWPAAADAGAFARALVEARLAACVAVSAEIQSIYRWEGALQADHERQVVIKTTAAALPALEARVRALHPYQVPEWLVLPTADGSAPYLDWVRTSTLPPRPSAASDC